MWVTRVIATKIRRRPNISATSPSTRGWLVSERIATTMSRTLPTWSPCGSKMGSPTSRAAYTRPGLAGPGCAVLTAGHATGRSARSAVEIRGAGRAAAVGVSLRHLAQAALLRLVAGVLDEVVVLPAVDAEPVELAPAGAALDPGPRPVDDAGVERGATATDGIPLDRHRSGPRPRCDPWHHVHAVDGPGRCRTGQARKRGRPVGVADR